MVASLPYSRVQRVPWPVTCGFAVLMLLVLAVALGVGLERGGARSLVYLVPMLPVYAILAYVLAAFRELRVEVREGELRLAFGSLGPRRRLDLARARAVRTKRSSPLYGWGIRWVPGGWMWNIWGLDTVELELDSGKRFLIGTDRPGELATAIEMARRARAAPSGAPPHPS